MSHREYNRNWHWEYRVGPPDDGFIFSKPLVSKLREQQGQQDMYYAIKFRNASKNLQCCIIVCKSRSFYTKEQIDMLPRYARRGGCYGHDAVIARRSKTPLYPQCILSHLSRNVFFRI